MDIYRNVNFSENQLRLLGSEAEDYAYTHGIVMPNKGLCNAAPFTLLPSAFPRHLYEEASSIQQYFQTLVHKASQDYHFVKNSLKSCMIHDDFIRKLFEIYEKVHLLNIKPKFFFNVMRSDYMVDKTTEGGDSISNLQLKQVEINTIAASFAGLNMLVSQMHGHIADVLGKDSPFKKENIAENQSVQKLGEGMAKLWNMYNSESAALLIIVGENGKPNFDIRHLEYAFHKSMRKYNEQRVLVLYRSLKQVYIQGEIKNGNLFLNGTEIALCYFRSGYNPSNYKCDECWKGRELIEMSTVPKCPTIAEQLIGTKKLQQVFATPGTVEKYIENIEAVKRIRKTFAGLYSLDPGAEGTEAVSLALQTPSKYVLKPQREGGGNNLYDQDIVNKLHCTTDPIERSQYILMELIRSPITKNYIIHGNQPVECDTVSELGIFGIYISDGEEELFNDSIGHNFRTKNMKHNDGGIVADWRLVTFHRKVVLFENVYVEVQEKGNSQDVDVKNQYLYREVMDVEKSFHTLCHRASKDHEFITESLKSCMVYDEFTKKLYDIYNKARLQGVKPKYHFNIIRSDYMIDEVKKETSTNGHTLEEIRPYEIKQIEVNMIAASFGGLDTKVGKMHRYLADVMENDAPYDKNQLAENDTLNRLGAGMAKLWQLYGNEDAVVIFVVQDGEANSFDQRHLEYSFQENVQQLGFKKRVPVWFCSLKFIYQHGELKNTNLYVNGREVALCYMRAGYSPSDYPHEDCWKGRELIEMSTVPKCPTIAEQLIGTKKIQQVFALPDMVEKFIEEPEIVRNIRKTFAGLYSLDPGVEGDKAVVMALNDPSKYVLKPQREGGGNNMYDDEMINELKRVTDPVERSQYILMERIRPPLVQNYIVHVDFDKPMLCDTVAELGVFGVFISDGENEIFNDSIGPLLRTKDVQHKDGGVAAGRAVLDSPYLV